MKQLNYRETLDMKFKAVNGIENTFRNYEVKNNVIDIYFSSIDKIAISYLEEDIVKVFIGDKYEEQLKTGAVLDNLKPSNFIIDEDKKYIIIKGNKVVTLVNKATKEITFKDKKGNIVCKDFQPSFKDDEGNIYISKFNDCLAYYGLGEKGGNLNKKGYYTENYNTDDPETDDNSTMYYKTIPFYVGLKEENVYGLFFDNSYRSYFDMGKSYEDRIFFWFSRWKYRILLYVRKGYKRSS